MKTVRCFVAFLFIVVLCVQIGCESSTQKSEDFLTSEEWARSTAIPITTTEPGGVTLIFYT